MLSAPMAPKRLKQVAEEDADKARQAMPFYEPCGARAALPVIQNWLAGKKCEHGTTAVVDATDLGPRNSLDVRVFICFLMAGMVPPISDFLRAVLEEYGLILS
jgi:hypothetical protein